MSPCHQRDGAQQTTRWPPTRCHLSHNGTRQTAFSPSPSRLQPPSPAFVLALAVPDADAWPGSHGDSTGTGGRPGLPLGGVSGRSSPMLVPCSPRAQPPRAARLVRDSNLLLSPQSPLGRETPRTLGRCCPHLHSERAESRVSAPCPRRVLDACLAPASDPAQAAAVAVAVPLLPCRPCWALRVSW